jgi:hypothetical protein
VDQLTLTVKIPREDDMTHIIFEVTAIIALIIANGIFAMSEFAVVAARKSRLQD